MTFECICGVTGISTEMGSIIRDVFATNLCAKYVCGVGEIEYYF